MKNIDLVILAGGKGTRIKKYLNDNPKPMVKFNKIFFLRYIINNLVKYPFDRIFILTRFKNKIIFKKFHNKFFNFTKIKCIKENNYMGTGGALFKLKKENVNNFVLVNGDTIFDLNINDLIKLSNKNKIGSMGLTKSMKNINSQKLNKLRLKNKNIFYSDKGNLMNGGVYFFNRKIFAFVKNKNQSLENDIIPELIKKRKIVGKLYKNFFLDIGTPKYFKKSSKLLKKYFKRPAAFLDRDGVINYDYGHVYKPKDFKFRSGVLSGLRRLVKKNYYIFIITNQAGIAKKIFSKKDFFRLHKYIKNKLFTKNIFFNEVKYSPYHPKGIIKKYKKKSAFRKPGNLMIRDIFKNWLIDKKNSFMIGDKNSDRICAEKSKLNFQFARKNFLSQIKTLTR